MLTFIYASIYRCSTLNKYDSKQYKISMGIIPTERKYCTRNYMLQVYECSLYEDCCNEGCCKPTTSRINFFLDNFFYFWFAVVFVFLACSYGCYWYRHQSHFRQGSNRFRIHNNQMVNQPHNTTQNIVRFIHEIKDRTSRASADDEEAPPPPYAQAVLLPNVDGANGISVIRLPNETAELPPPYESLNLHRNALTPLSIT
ncbi:hypothetical protein CHUAL_013753 [Chamberlinius hualienensis]